MDHGSGDVYLHEDRSYRLRVAAHATANLGPGSRQKLPVPHRCSPYPAALVLAPCKPRPCDLNFLTRSPLELAIARTRHFPHTTANPVTTSNAPHIFTHNRYNAAKMDSPEPDTPFAAVTAQTTKYGAVSRSPTQSSFRLEEMEMTMRSVKKR